MLAAAEGGLIHPEAAAWPPTTRLHPALPAPDASPRIPEAQAGLQGVGWSPLPLNPPEEPLRDEPLVLPWHEGTPGPPPASEKGLLRIPGRRQASRAPTLWVGIGLSSLEALLVSSTSGHEAESSATIQYCIRSCGNVL